MALTELQLPAKQQFYGNVASIATQIKKEGLRLQEISEFIQDLTAADLDAMGVEAGQLRTDLQSFRTALDAVAAEINTHEAVWDALRNMVVI